jgi:antitoxin PrlF
MSIGESRITAQGQISVPAAVRKALGVGPGSTIEWTQDGDKMVVRRKVKYTFAEIRRILSQGEKPKRVTLKQMDEAKAGYILEKYAHLAPRKNARGKKAGAKNAGD